MQQKENRNHTLAYRFYFTEATLIVQIYFYNILRKELIGIQRGRL